MGNTVKICGEEYEVRNTLRSLFIFEEITGKPFKVETLLDNYLFLYSVILASNPGKPIAWEKFIDAIDSDPGVASLINSILAEAQKVEKLLEEEGGEEGDKGSKKK